MCGRAGETYELRAALHGLLVRAADTLPALRPVLSWLLVSHLRLCAFPASYTWILSILNDVLDLLDVEQSSGVPCPSATTLAAKLGLFSPFEVNETKFSSNLSPTIGHRASKTFLISDWL